MIDKKGVILYCAAAILIIVPFTLNIHDMKNDIDDLRTQIWDIQTKPEQIIDYRFSENGDTLVFPPTALMWVELEKLELKVKLLEEANYYAYQTIGGVLVRLDSLSAKE